MELTNSNIFRADLKEFMGIIIAGVDNASTTAALNQSLEIEKSLKTDLGKLIMVPIKNVGFFGSLLAIFTGNTTQNKLAKAIKAAANAKGYYIILTELNASSISGHSIRIKSKLQFCK